MANEGPPVAQKTMRRLGRHCWLARFRQISLAGKRNSGWTSALAVASLLASTASAALAQDAAGQGKAGGQLTNEQLLEKMERMEARIRSLEGELHRSKSEGSAANGSKTRVANTRKGGTKEASVQDQPVVPESMPPGKRPPAAAWNLAPAPGYMGARETAAA